MTQNTNVLIAAARNGRIVKFKSGSPTVAIVCITCRYGDGLYDQDPESYAANPYGCDPATCIHNTRTTKKETAA